MPFIIPFIPLIAAGVGAATTIAGIESRPSGTGGFQQQQQPAPQQTVQPNTAGLTQAQKALAQQGASNVQANTSGFATPDYLQSILQSAFGPSAQNGTGSGATGDIQSVINQAFGLGAPGLSGYSGAGGGGGSATPAIPPNAFTPTTPTPGAGAQSPTPSLTGSLLEQGFSGFSG